MTQILTLTTTQKFPPQWEAGEAWEAKTEAGWVEREGKGEGWGEREGKGEGWEGEGDVGFIPNDPNISEFIPHQLDNSTPPPGT